MDSDEFINILNLFNSSNQDDQNKVYNTLSELKQDSNFIFFLIQLLDNQIILENLYYLKQISILIKNLISYYYENEDFWSPDSKVKLCDLILEKIVEQKINHDVILILIGSFNAIGTVMFPDNIFLLEKLQQILMNNAQNVNVIVYFCKSIRFWVKRVSKSITCISNDFINKVIEMTMCFLNIVLPLYNDALKSLSTSSDNIIVVEAVLDIVKYIMYYCSPIYIENDGKILILDIIRNSIPLLGMEHVDNKLLNSSKLSLLKIVVELNDIILRRRRKKSSKIPESFYQIYSNTGNNLSSEINSSILNFFDASSDYSLRSRFLKVMLQYITYAAPDVSYFDDTYYSRILNSSLLSEDEIEQCSCNPVYFIENIMSTKYESIDTPRTLVSRILEVVLEKYSQKSEEFITRFAPDPDDAPSYLEAKCFIFLCINKALLKLQEIRGNKLEKKTKCKARRYLPTSEDLTNFFCNIVNQQDKELTFLRCSALKTITKTIPLYKPREGVEYACNLIINDEEPIIVTMASKLFIKCYKVLDEKPSIDAASIIIRLVLASENIHSKSLCDTISTLCAEGGSNIKQVAIQVISVLLESTIKQFSSEENEISFVDYAISSSNCTLKAMIDILYSLIPDLEDFKTSLLGLVSPIYEQFLKLLSFNNDVELLKDVLDILGFFTQFLPITENTYKYSLELLNMFFEDSNTSFIIAQWVTIEYVRWLYPLLIDTNSPFIRELEICSKITQYNMSLFDSVMKSYKSDKNEVEEFSVPYFLFLFSIFVSYIGNDEFYVKTLVEMFDFIPNYVYFSPNRTPDFLYIGMIRLIYALLTSGTSVSYLIQSVPSINDFLKSVIREGHLHSYSDLRAGVDCLLIFIENGITDLTDLAQSSYKRLQYLYKLENEIEEEEDNNDDDANYVAIDYDLKLQSDTIDMNQRFYQVIGRIE